MGKRKIKEIQVLEVDSKIQVVKRRKQIEQFETKQSRFHGVTWDEDRCKWWAWRRVDGILRSGGYFMKEDAAAHRSDQLVVANKANQKLHPLNFPPRNDEQKIKQRKKRRKLCSEAGRKSKKGVRQSQYVGVYWNRFTGKWVAKRNLDRQPRNAGSFVDEIEAAKAIDHLVRMYGHNEPLNFPDVDVVKSLRRRRRRSRHPQPITSINPDRSYVTRKIIDHRQTSHGLEFRVRWENTAGENWVLDLDLPDTAIKRSYILKYCENIRKLKLPCAKCKEEFDSRDLILLRKKRICSKCYQRTQGADIPKKIASAPISGLEPPRFSVGDRVYVNNWNVIKETLAIAEDDCRGVVLQVCQRGYAWAYDLVFSHGEKLVIFENKLSKANNGEILQMLELNLKKAQEQSTVERISLKESESQVLHLDKEITGLENALLNIQTKVQNLHAKRQHLKTTKSQREAKRSVYQQRCVEQQRSIKKQTRIITSIEKQLSYHASGLNCQQQS